MELSAARTRRIMIIGGNARSLVANRGDLIRTWHAAGHVVKALVPDGESNEAINSLPLTWSPIPLRKTGTNPIADWHTYRAIRAAIHDWKPNIILSYNAKPMVYGSLAAWSAGVKSYSMVTGLGYLRDVQGVRLRVAAFIQMLLYRLATSTNETVFFQNPDDEQLLLARKVIPRKVRRVQIHGSGVNLDRYPATALPQNAPVCFLMVARMVEAKGVKEFINAASWLKERGLSARCVMVGAHDLNLPGAIDKTVLDQAQQKGFVTYVGEMKDVRALVAQSSAFVLPSFYGEGTPRSILEAMSMGRAIITTDAAGCRETVEEGRNGFLVRPRNSESLANAMKQFIDQPSLCESMGRQSRAMAEEKYDVNKVNKTICHAMGLK